LVFLIFSQNGLHFWSLPLGEQPVFFLIAFDVRFRESSRSPFMKFLPHVGLAHIRSFPIRFYSSSSLPKNVAGMDVGPISAEFLHFFPPKGPPFLYPLIPSPLTAAPRGLCPPFSPKDLRPKLFIFSLFLVRVTAVHLSSLASTFPLNTRKSLAPLTSHDITFRQFPFSVALPPVANLPTDVMFL